MTFRKDVLSIAAMVLLAVPAGAQEKVDEAAIEKIKAEGLVEPPNALTIVGFGEEPTFLNPLPADMLWGVGPKTSARLTELGEANLVDIVSDAVRLHMRAAV